MFEVRFLDYSNPGQRTGQKACCSGQEVQGSCSSPCSTFFRVCIRPLADTSSCIFGQKNSGVLGNSSFAIPSNSLLQIPWPDNLSWPVRLNLAFPKATGTKRDFKLFDTVKVHVKISFEHAAFKPAAPFRNESWSNDTILRFGSMMSVVFHLLFLLETI